MLAVLGRSPHHNGVTPSVWMAGSNSTDNTVLGLSLDPDDPLVVLEYSIINVLVTSVVPLPLAGTMVAVGCGLFGIVAGLVLNTVTSAIGAYLGLFATRYWCRDCIIRRLSSYGNRWQLLDAALVAQGWQIALLIRMAPISPLVLSNIMLSLTSISVWTYSWTTIVGLVPSNLPYAIAGQLGREMAQSFPPKDPLTLIMSIVGFVASIGVAWKLAVIARTVLKKHGIEGGPTKKKKKTIPVAPGRVFRVEPATEQASSSTTQSGVLGLGGDGTGTELGSSLCAGIRSDMLSPHGFHQLEEDEHMSLRTATARSSGSPEKAVDSSDAQSIASSTPPAPQNL